MKNCDLVSLVLVCFFAGNLQNLISQKQFQERKRPPRKSKKKTKRRKNTGAAAVTAIVTTIATIIARIGRELLPVPATRSTNGTAAAIDVSWICMVGTLERWDLQFKRNFCNCHFTNFIISRQQTTKQQQTW